MQDEQRPAGLVNDLFVSKQVCVIGLGIWSWEETYGAGLKANLSLTRRADAA